MMQYPQLREHGGLIPIETLVGYLIPLKLNDAHESELDTSTRGCDAGKHPIHLDRVRKAYHELFDDPILAEGLRQRSEFPIWRDVGRN